jgi:retron-type reverse transcriptase
VSETDGQYTGGKKSDTGTPQGGVISPLLTNIYMNLTHIAAYEELISLYSAG